MRPGSAVAVAWLGTSGVMITDYRTTLFIDPFITRVSMSNVIAGRPVTSDAAAARAWLKRLRPRNTRAVFVTHSHYDHSIDAPTFARRTNAELVGSRSTEMIARGRKFPLSKYRRVSGGETLRYGDFTVKILLTNHGGKRPFLPGKITQPLPANAPVRKYLMGLNFSLHIKHPLGTIVHHGSAGYIKDMFRNLKADVVLLGIATRPPTELYLRQVVDNLGARRVVPIHFDDFFNPLNERMRYLKSADLIEFSRTARTRSRPVKVETLPLGATQLIFARK